MPSTAPTGELDWAIAGRNAAKLADVADDTGADVERIVADATDGEALAALAASSRLVVSTVGPYALYGSGLVAAVAEAGTDYCDLTGEPQWMHRMIEQHHDRAVATGRAHRPRLRVRLDAVGPRCVVPAAARPSSASAHPASRCAWASGRRRATASGGTIASMMNLVAEAAGDADVRAVLDDPYALVADEDRRAVEQPSITWPEYDDGLRSWQAPFVMAATNTRVVLRSHALLGNPWGDGFTYGESMLMGDGLAGRAKAFAVAGATSGAMGAAGVGPLRSLLGKLLPEPGEGPSPERQESGYYDLRFRGTTEAGDELVVRVTGDRDPGYGSTARILGEAAVCLLSQDRDALGGGFWTPATAMGDALIERLRAHAGLTFEVL